jgi:hypothetical protein
LITQTSTSAPTVIELENTIGPIVWTRTATGIYFGTLTGALNAPSASFSGTASVINTFNLYKTGGTTLGGQLAYDSVVNQLYLWNNVTGGYFSIYTNSTERLNIGSDGTSTFKGPGVVIDRPTASSGEPYLAFTKNGVTRASIYGADGTAGLRFFSDLSTFTGANTTIGQLSVNNTDVTYSAGVNFLTSGTNRGFVGWRHVNSGAPFNLTGIHLFNTDNSNIVFGTNNTVKAVINVDGNLGVGTESPAQKIHVKSGTNYQGILINGSNAPAIGFAKGDGTTPEWKLGISGNDGTAISISSGAANTDKIIIGASGRVGINDGVSTNAQLALNGSVKINRSLYNWYQESYVGNSTYLHIKTNLWAGGSPNGNSEYTMSLFKGYMYAYGTPPALEGTIVFHNWDGNFYNIGTTGNLFVTAYKSTDGYVVLVTNSGGGEAGITIDWHQAYGYPYKDRIRTASKLYGATTGGY